MNNNQENQENPVNMFVNEQDDVDIDEQDDVDIDKQDDVDIDEQYDVDIDEQDDADIDEQAHIDSQTQNFTFNLNNDIMNNIFNLENNQIIETKCSEIMSWSYENMMNIDIDNDIINFIDLCYLKNLQYDDEPIDTIRYTIRTVLNEGRQFDLKNLSQGIFSYSMIGINIVFNENFDILNELLISELKRFFRQSLSIHMFSQLIMDNLTNGPGFGNMEDVKLVIPKEEINNIPSSLYKDLEPDVKTKVTECPICRDEFRDNDNVRLLYCSHIFHSDCVDNWLTEHSHKCPCCRQEAGEYKPNL